MILHIIEPTLREKLDLATNKGVAAACRARPLGTNPYVRDTPEYLAWGVAHAGILAGEQGRVYQ